MTDIPTRNSDSEALSFVAKKGTVQQLVSDVGTFFTLNATWRALSRVDINSKYRRTMLGPWWLTVTQGCMAVMMALVSGRFLGAEMASYLPHFMISITIWNFMSSSMSESSQTLIYAGGMIKATNMPISAHIMRMVQRNFIILLHNAAVVPIVWLVYRWDLGPQIVLLVPAMIIVYVFTSAVSTFIAIVCVRFRDVPPLVTALMQLLFFISPIIWMPGSTRGGHIVLLLNPIAYLLSIIRDPILNRPFDPISWIGALIITAITFAIASITYSRYRARVVYWV